VASTAPLKRALYTAVWELLAPLGFARFPRHAGIYRRELASGVVGLVGIACRRRYGSGGETEIDVDVYIHVRHEAVERVVEELICPPGDAKVARARRTQATVTGGHLGYLMPHRWAISWWLAGEAGAHSVARDIVAAVEAYGMPFMRSHVRLDAIHETLRRCDRQISVVCLTRLPVVSLLLGEMHRARQEARVILDYARGTDPSARFYAEHYKPYAERILSRLDRLEREEA
jgi:hypothetical protein